MKTARLSPLKKLVSLVLGLGVLGGILIFFTPALLSTKWGNERFVEVLNTRIPGRIVIEKFSVSWLGIQKVNGLVLHDPEGNKVLSIESLETETPLYTFLSSGPLIGKTLIKTFNAEIKKSESGLSNLQESLGIDGSGFDIPKKLPPYRM